MTPEPNPEPKILIVEENEFHGLTMGRQISHRVDGSQVVIARNADDALRYARTQHFDIAVIDLVLSDCDGLSLVHSLHQIDTELAIIAVAEEVSDKISREALRCGCDELLVKDSSYYVVIPRMVVGLWSRKKQRAGRNRESIDDRTIPVEAIEQTRIELKRELNHHVEEIVRAARQILARSDLKDNDLAETVRLIHASALSVKNSLDTTPHPADSGNRLDTRTRLSLRQKVSYPVETDG
ncbi:MAG: response regulator [Candidatus Zixiibacteriota bacterium]|nr:MAG: response regulator [candidate division Zixibacteria bacterium]